MFSQMMYMGVAHLNYTELFCFGFKGEIKASSLLVYDASVG